MTIAPALVFEGSSCAAFILQNDGTVVEVDKKVLHDLSGPLPGGMFARYTVTTSENGTQVVEGVMQARKPGGRRYFADSNESAAQHRLLKWAQRILREVANARRTA